MPWFYKVLDSFSSDRIELTLIWGNRNIVSVLIVIKTYMCQLILSSVRRSGHKQDYDPGLGSNSFGMASKHLEQKETIQN